MSADERSLCSYSNVFVSKFGRKDIDATYNNQDERSAKPHIRACKQWFSLEHNEFVWLLRLLLLSLFGKQV